MGGIRTDILAVVLLAAQRLTEEGPWEIVVVFIYLNGTQLVHAIHHYSVEISFQKINSV